LIFISKLEKINFIVKNKNMDQFYIEYMIKLSKPYYKSPGWALAYNPWYSEQEKLDFLEVGGVC